MNKGSEIFSLQLFKLLLLSNPITINLIKSLITYLVILAL